jgi:ferritin-like protein
MGRGPDADTSFRVRSDALVPPALAALRCALKAYLALQNMTNLADDEDLFEQLLAMPAEDFSEWLSWIDAEGSAAG